ITAATARRNDPLTLTNMVPQGKSRAQSWLTNHLPTRSRTSDPSAPPSITRTIRFLPAFANQERARTTRLFTKVPSVKRITACQRKSPTGIACPGGAGLAGQAPPEEDPIQVGVISGSPEGPPRLWRTPSPPAVYSQGYERQCL